MISRLMCGDDLRRCGTALAPWLALVVGAAERRPGEDAVVEMPPFVITETKAGKPWRFAEAEGFEIISQSDDEATQQVFAALWRGVRLALPPEMRARLTTPTAVIIFDQASDKGRGVESMGSSRALHEVSSHWTNVIKRTTPDREFFCVNLHGQFFRYSSTFRFDLHTLLALHTPMAPPWLLEGLFGRYGLYREGIRYEEGTKWAEVVRGQWCSVAEWQKIEPLVATASVRAETEPAKRRGMEAGPSPVEEFVMEPAELWRGGLVAGHPAPEQRNRWGATCALFAHWGIFGQKGRRGEAFWRFAERACSQPVTEEMVRECLGLSLAELRAELGWHLPVALGDVAVRAVEVLRPPRLAIRPATPGEVARNRGDWERAEAGLLAGSFPDIAERYRERAGRTLRNAQGEGPADARLMAAIGLYEYETGDAVRARELLEAATGAGVQRPRAWHTLAHLRFMELAGKSATPGRQLDVEQAYSVLTPLFQAMEQPPALVGSYELLAEVWRRSNQLPVEETSRRLAEGQRLFPRNARLLLATVRACLERGERRAALGFIERGLPMIGDPEMSGRLEKARAGLVAAVAAEDGGAKR